MIILHNNSHGGIIWACMRIFTTALWNTTIRQILNKNTSPYFHSVSLVIWPLSLMKRIHFSGLSISRFSTVVHEKSQRLNTPFSNARSEKRKFPTQNDQAATNTTQNPSTYTLVSFQFNTNSIFPAHRTLSHSFLVWRNCRSTTGAKLRCGPRGAQFKKEAGLPSWFLTIVCQGWHVRGLLETYELEIFEANCGLASDAREGLSL